MLGDVVLTKTHTAASGALKIIPGTSKSHCTVEGPDITRTTCSFPDT